jgi:hypothetical protein
MPTAFVAGHGSVAKDLPEALVVAAEQFGARS